MHRGDAIWFLLSDSRFAVIREVACGCCDGKTWVSQEEFIMGAAAYKQVSLTNDQAFIKQCPCEDGTKHCKNMPRYKRDASTPLDKEELLGHIQDLLFRWAEFDKRTRSAKVKRVAMLAVCSKHDTNDNLEIVCTKIIDDLTVLNACFVPPRAQATRLMNSRIAFPQSPSYSPSSATFGRESPLPPRSFSYSRSSINASERSGSVATSGRPETPPPTPRAPIAAKDTPTAYNAHLDLRGSPSIQTATPRHKTTTSGVSSVFGTAQPAPRSRQSRGGSVQSANHELPEGHPDLPANFRRLQEENRSLQRLLEESQRKADVETEKARVKGLEAEKWNKLYVKAKNLFNTFRRGIVDLENEGTDKRNRMPKKARKLFNAMDRGVQELEDEEDNEDDVDQEDEESEEYEE